MPRGNYRQTIRCAETPCPEKVTYHHWTRADEAASVKSQRESPWKCSRHLWPEQVLGLSREATVMDHDRGCPPGGAVPGIAPHVAGHPVSPSCRTASAGGYGFMAFASDWPEGTRLEVTARILPPEGTGEED